MNFHDFIFSIFSNIKQIGMLLFFIATSIQLLYYFFFYARIFFFKKHFVESPQFTKPVSVIVAAHNEEENLKDFLPYILKQDYPEFEVIVIDDRSEDETSSVIAELQKHYKNLRTTFIKKNEKIKYGKKLAVTLGIKASKYDYILLTDADCKPNSNLWIKETVEHFQSSDIVLGYGPYFEKPSFLNRMIRFDTMFIALQYLSFAKAGIPYMGVGRNLAYKKDLFIKNRGFASHSHIHSGDDDLFINEVANSHNTSISINKNTFVYSSPNESLKDWLWQKKRHFTTFKKYKLIHKILLSAEGYSRALFYILFLGLIGSSLNNYFFLSAIFIRFLVLTITLAYSTRFFNEKKIAPFVIIFDFILPILNFFVYLVYPKLKNN